MKKEYLGSNFDGFLQEDHLLRIAEDTAAQRVIVFKTSIMERSASAVGKKFKPELA